MVQRTGGTANHGKFLSAEANPIDLLRFTFINVFAS